MKPFRVEISGTLDVFEHHRESLAAAIAEAEKLAHSFRKKDIDVSITIKTFTGKPIATYVVSGEELRPEAHIKSWLIWEVKNEDGDSHGVFDLFEQANLKANRLAWKHSGEVFIVTLLGDPIVTYTNNAEWRDNGKPMVQIELHDLRTKVLSN